MKLTLFANDVRCISRSDQLVRYTRTREMFQFDFLKNEASYEKIIFHIFDLFFHVELSLSLDRTTGVSRILKWTKNTWPGNRYSCHESLQFTSYTFRVLFTCKLKNWGILKLFLFPECTFSNILFVSFDKFYQFVQYVLGNIFATSIVISSSWINNLSTDTKLIAFNREHCKKQYY